MSSSVKSELPKKVAEKYEMVGVLPGKMIIQGKTVDFRTIGLTQAAQLVKANCPYIKEKSKASTKN